jgi:hypothetical protein
MLRIHALLCSSLVTLSLASGGCRAVGDGDKSAPAASASAGATECTAYSQSLCEKAGPDSQHCMAIRDLEGILPPKACAAGKSELAFTELKLVTERKPCTDLVERLCKDLGAETESCRTVRVRTPSFPASQCVSMTEQYASVLAELRKVEEKSKPLDAAKQATLLEGAKAVFAPGMRR